MFDVKTPRGEEFVPTLPALLRAAARDHAEREFLVMGEQRLTYSQAERQSAELARGLLALGLGKGSRVGLLMSNSPDWVVAFGAAARTGSLCVLFSTFFQAPEISWCIRHNDVDTLLVQADYIGNDYLDRLERALPGLAEQTSPELFLPEHPYLRRIIVWGKCDRHWALQGPEALKEAANRRPQIDDHFLEQIEANIAPADSLLTICTSGTTAEPKAVVHTHGVALRITHAFLDYLDLRGHDRNYTGQAFFWIGGLNVNLLPAMYVGACLVFSHTPDAEEIADVIQRERVTRLSLWPAQILAIREVANRKGCDLSSVRSGLGEPRDEYGEVIPVDRRIGGVMGMTESFGMHSIEKRTVPVPHGKGGTWGRHLPGVERKVVDRETGATVPPGVEGELYIRGYTLMQGYYKKEREQTFTRDGFFATGDLVKIDEDDFIYFTGRSTEMIKTSGANVSPREVEIALQKYPEVREAIVFGMPDAVRGEIVVAVLVAAAGKVADPADLTARLRRDISNYKVPHRMVLIPFDDIPRTGSAKPRKPQLLKIVAEKISPVSPDSA